MNLWSFAPIWLIDFIGSAAMIVICLMCLNLVRTIYKCGPDNPIASYLLWFTGALVAFSLSRSLGHIIKHILYFTDNTALWKDLAPISGSINSITFVVIASVTLFFGRMQAIMFRMDRDRDRIEKTGQEILELNKDLEHIVVERTHAEMALRVAHEVRNPVMIIGGLIQRMVNSASDKEEQKRLKRILEQSKKLEDLVSRFEDVSPKKEKFFSVLELNALIEESVAIVQPEAERNGVVIVLDRSSANLCFQGNAQLIKIAILHLLRNSIEACPAGSVIQITTGIRKGGIEILIQDDGPGIPPEIVTHIFEPLFTTARGDTGLGLPYVKQIVQEHRGRINLQSTEHVGTEVQIILPTHLTELLDPNSNIEI